MHKLNSIHFCFENQTMPQSATMQLIPCYPTIQSGLTHALDPSTFFAILRWFFVPCFKTHKFANWNGQETNGRTIFFSMGDINIWFPPFLTLYAPIRKPTTSCRIARCFWMKNRFMIFFDKVWDFVVDFFPGTICLVFVTVWN